MRKTNFIRFVILLIILFSLSVDSSFCKTGKFKKYRAGVQKRYEKEKEKIIGSEKRKAKRLDEKKEVEGLTAAEKTKAGFKALFSWKRPLRSAHPERSRREGERVKKEKNLVGERKPLILQEQFAQVSRMRKEKKITPGEAAKRVKTEFGLGAPAVVKLKETEEAGDLAEPEIKIEKVKTFADVEKDIETKKDEIESVKKVKKIAQEELDSAQKSLKENKESVLKIEQQIEDRTEFLKSLRPGEEIEETEEVKVLRTQLDKSKEDVSAGEKKIKTFKSELKTINKNVKEAEEIHKKAVRAAVKDAQRIIKKAKAKRETKEYTQAVSEMGKRKEKFSAAESALESLKSEKEKVQEDLEKAKARTKNALKRIKSREKKKGKLTAKLDKLNEELNKSTDEHEKLREDEKEASISKLNARVNEIELLKTEIKEVDESIKKARRPIRRVKSLNRKIKRLDKDVVVAFADSERHRMKLEFADQRLEKTKEAINNKLIDSGVSEEEIGNVLRVAQY